MDNFQFYFCELDSDSSFSHLAGSFGSKFSNGQIQVPIDYGTGSIKRILFEDGINLRVCDICLTRPMLWHKLAASEQKKGYHISFAINPADIIERHPVVQGMQFPKNNLNTVFFSNDISFQFELKAEERFRVIDISFSGDWLHQHFSEKDSSLSDFISDLNKNPHPVVFFESSSVPEHNFLVDLHESAFTTSNGTYVIKERVLSLLTEFFNRLHRKAPANKLRQRNVHYDKMIQVEKILHSHLQQTLPSIDAIAKQVSLSESTLKRHFKIMYGKSIYEYYLELKMTLAKRILTEKPVSVNEVAAMLDYGKVSNFIDMFKKHHGYSPGSMRRKTVKEI